MAKRFASIWFRNLATDWMARCQPDLQSIPFVFAASVRGRMQITAVNTLAEAQGLGLGMVVADAKAFVPGLKVFDDKPELAGKLLKVLGLWCIRFTPTLAVDDPDGLILDISGCAHLWGGEQAYLEAIIARLRENGYTAQMAIADSIGTAWAVARFGQASSIIGSGNENEALISLPPTALRIAPNIVRLLQKLGLRTIGSFMEMPPAVLRKRFGDDLLLRMRQALAYEEEHIKPLRPILPYEERLPCLEPIRTAKGIEIAMQRLLEMLCKRLLSEGKGLRKAILNCYRVDGKMVQAAIGANKPTANVSHIFKLFVLKIPQIEPALGIELFVLQAQKVEEVDIVQEKLWTKNPGLEGTTLAELLDRLAGKTGTCTIQRYLPDEHHWPERCIKPALSIAEKPTTSWHNDRPRPIRLLAKPEPIEVSAPIPDYPPMLFRYNGELHPIKKAEGPERIEREWWIDNGEHRDYYYVEDDRGQRYWLFRSGHYRDERLGEWFIHGFFA